MTRPAGDPAGLAVKPKYRCLECVAQRKFPGWKDSRESSTIRRPRDIDIEVEDVVLEPDREIDQESTIPHPLPSDDHGRREPDRTGRSGLSLIHISEPTRQAEISYAVFCLKK